MVIYVNGSVLNSERGTEEYKYLEVDEKVPFAIKSIAVYKVGL